MKTTLHVSGMMCNHCVQAVTKAVEELPDVTQVDVDLDAQIVKVDHALTLPVEKIRAAIEAQGYDVAP